MKDQMEMSNTQSPRAQKVSELMICSAMIFVFAVCPAMAGDCPKLGTWNSQCTISGKSSPLEGNVEVTSDLTIPEGVTVTIEGATQLTIMPGKTLTNEGTINIQQEGILKISGRSFPTQAAVLVNPGKLSNKGTILGSGIFWNADQHNTRSGTLDYSGYFGSIEPVVYGMTFQNTAPTAPCGTVIPKDVTITASTSTPASYNTTTWTFDSDSSVPSMTRTVAAPESSELKKFSLTLFDGQSITFSQGTISGGGLTEGKKNKIQFPALSSYQSPKGYKTYVAKSGLPTIYLQMIDPADGGENISSVGLDISWLPSDFGSAGNLNMDLCTGTWAVSGPDSNPALNPTKAAEWDHLKITKGTSGYNLSLSPYTAAVGEDPIVSGGLIIGPSGFTVVPDGLGQLPETFSAGNDSTKGPFIKMLGGLISNPDKSCKEPATADCKYDYFRKVDLYVRYLITGSDSTSPFGKQLMIAMSDIELPTAPTSEKVIVPNGKNLLVEYMLNNKNISFCPSSSAGSKCPANSRSYALVTPFPAGLEASSELPTNMQPVVFKDADGYEHLFIFDYNNSGSSTDVSYNYKLLTTAGDVDPTIVEKAQPASGDGGGGHDPDY